jgi:hypothetical protein
VQQDKQEALKQRQQMSTRVQVPLIAMSLNLKAWTLV